MSSPTSSGEGIHQALDLFDKIDINLDLEPAFLNRKDEFEWWYGDISNRLQSMGLERLINIDIARPPKDHRHASRWRMLSLLVARWLELNMSDELVNIVRAQGLPITLADEFMSATITAFRAPEAPAKVAMVGQFFELKEDLFEWVCEFIYAVQSRYAAMRDVGIDIPPFVVLNYLLYELDTEHNQALIKCVMQDLAIMGYEEFDVNVSYDDLNEIFNHMMAFLDEQDDDYDDDTVLG